MSTKKPTPASKQVVAAKKTPIATKQASVKKKPEVKKTTPAVKAKTTTTKEVFVAAKKATDSKGVVITTKSVPVKKAVPVKTTKPVAGKQLTGKIELAKKIVKVATKITSDVQKKDGVKAASGLKSATNTLKSTVKKIETAVKKTGGDTKGYQETTAQVQEAGTRNRREFDESIGIHTKPAGNPYVAPVAAPAVSVPATMSRSAAIERENRLRSTFSQLASTVRK